jgi:hypothetical protein
VAGSVFLEFTDSNFTLLTRKTRYRESFAHPLTLPKMVSGAIDDLIVHTSECDCVAKDAVMDSEKDDGKTLRLKLLSEFKEHNSTDTIDCTEMKATWLSKRQQGKRVGSLVIWLKRLSAAEHLIRQGTAIFGASESYCSEFERRDGLDLCYYCSEGEGEGEGVDTRWEGRAIACWRVETTSAERRWLS